jgi:hypothetical protein
MNRETKRQKRRLNRLADFIEANPDVYSQGSPQQCVIGLGCRIRFGKTDRLGAYNGWSWDAQKRFAERYGVSREVAGDIWYDDFGKVHKNFKNSWQIGERRASSAVKLLRKLAEQKG